MNEDTLRQILTAEADTVEVAPDALTEIRRRVRARSRRRLFSVPVFALVGGAVAAGAAAVVAVAAVSAPPARRADPAPGATAAPPPPATATRSPVPQPPPAATPRRPAATAITASVPVYYVAAPDGQQRLYREYHRIRVGDGSPAQRARAAVTEMLTRPAYGDYGSSWPGTTRVLGAGYTGGVVTVNLTRVGSPDNDGTAHPIALQELIYTATAAANADGMRLLVDGEPVAKLWGTVPAAGVLRRAPVADVLGLVWVISPQQGDTVGRTFGVHLAGIAFEATIQLRVMRAGTPVLTRVVTLSMGPPAQGEARLSLTLAPGRYTLEAFEVSARDGAEQHLDAHTITVR